MTNANPGQMTVMQELAELKTSTRQVADHLH
jgi:hypothetical protein